MKKRSTFRQSDVTRAIRAVLATGVGVARVEIGADGRISIHTGAPIEGRAANEQDELDRELAEFEARFEKEAIGPKTERKFPIIPGQEAHYKALGFDPETMNGDDYRRLYKEAKERWRASIPGTPLNTRERKALNQLAAYGVGVRAKDSAIKDCGSDTCDRLLARAFIETQDYEKIPGSPEYLILTTAGMKAWEELGETIASSSNRG